MKNIVIIGSSRGIGKELVSILSEKNYKRNENQKVKVLSITVDNSGDENIEILLLWSVA